MSQGSPYIDNVTLTHNQTTTTYTQYFWGDMYCIRYCTSIDPTWTAFEPHGTDKDNTFYQNGTSYSISFPRLTTYSYFATIHCRMYDYDWLNIFEGGYQHAYRSYQQIVYIPQQQYTKINHDKMFYKQLTGKDIATTVYPAGTQYNDIITQANHNNLYTYTSAGSLINSSNLWNMPFLIMHSDTNLYREGNYPSYCTNSYPFPW